MSDIVRLPKDVADAIEQVRSNYTSGCEYDLDFLSKAKCGSMGIITMFVTRSRENMMLYFQALVNGYEIEETPEDKVKEYYKDQRRKEFEEKDTSEFAITLVLTILNIKIEGINI